MQLGSSPDDYKFYCFNGKANFVQIIGDRNLHTHEGKQIFYDANWKRLDFTSGDYPLYEKELEKPASFDQMIQLAERLAEPFCYVRVDLYDLAGKILFGELTFTPASGCYPKKAPATANETLGAMLTLPKERYILPAAR